jgi:class 3 adenylate cyclase
MENKRETIFLVDDNMTNLTLGKTMLKDHYNVFSIPSAAKLFDMLEKITPNLILLDVEMPEMSGYEAIQKLKADEKTSGIPVIFLTARCDTGSELEGLSLGAIDYITKPFQPDLLLKRIEVHLLVEDQQRRLEIFNTNLRDAFSRYLSPVVVNEIIQDPSKLNLGGEKREMTAVFTDIAGFSPIAEQLEPGSLVHLLNLYLSAMSNIITGNLGTIDKYEGDAIIAFFGAPLIQENHAARACRSALQMRAAEKELNKKIAEEHLSPRPLFTRIGINTGPMVVGNMGSENKMNYTVMGNAVNLAARLEGASKQYKIGGVLISEYTKNAIDTEDEFICRRLDRIRVVGISSPVWVYEIIGFRKEASEAEIKWVAEWDTAIGLFEQRQFEKAREMFSSLAEADSEDNTARNYIDRCTEFIAVPPGGDWDGVNNLTDK